MKAGHRAIARAYLDPARPFDRHHYYYALSKLATDPLYDGVCDALRGRDLPVLDVGCGIGPVSYTHLDVYKRQISASVRLSMSRA